MKKRSKLIALVLVLSLSIGFTAFAAKCSLSSGKVKARGELSRSAKSGTAITRITSHDLYYVTATVMAYDKNGKALTGDARTSRTATSALAISSKKPYKFVSTHAIKDDKYRPLDSKKFIVY